jgi:hypothetical protein
MPPHYTPPLPPSLSLVFSRHHHPSYPLLSRLSSKRRAQIWRRARRHELQAASLLSSTTSRRRCGFDSRRGPSSRQPSSSPAQPLSGGADSVEDRAPDGIPPLLPRARPPSTSLPQPVSYPPSPTRPLLRVGASGDGGCGGRSSHNGSPSQVPHRRRYCSSLRFCRQAPSLS